MLDLAGDPRPAPRRVDLVQQRARRIPQPRDCASPPTAGRSPSKPAHRCKRIVVPAASGEVFIAVEVAVRQDVEAGALSSSLMTTARRVLKFSRKRTLHHACVERSCPHAHVEPSRPRP
jgi:hypothetical protein